MDEGGGRNDMVGGVRIEFICYIIMCYNVLEDVTVGWFI